MGLVQVPDKGQHAIKEKAAARPDREAMSDTRMPAAEHPRPAKAQAKRRDDGRVSPGTFFGFAAK